MATSSAGNEQDVMYSLAYRGFKELPRELIPRLSGVTYLDLSNNELSDLRSLFELTDLCTLILDTNRIHSHSVFPPLPKLKILWVNKNEIKNLSIFIGNVAQCCPNLYQLSMMNNEAAPSYFNGGSKKDYEDYRQYVLSHLPKLRHLDDSKVTNQEREEAAKVYGRRRFNQTLRRRDSTVKGRSRSSSVQTLPRPRHS
ncbi:leucine-rich melanocyte differentiation-associated protein-like [Halichondria panicea]|uniref:leucine-rich melanocyte differentiation-associated protein-like n=1 Tax=Halichondria panicea TaxID=6063 RepID=UPI00312BBE8D